MKQAFMLVWDNLNFAFKVNEQRLDKKDHFDSSTTATLIPLHDIAFGELKLSMLKHRTTRLHVLPFTPLDILSSAQQVQELEAAILWHVEDILLDAFPELRARLKDHADIPMINAIPVHTTTQYCRFTI